MDETIEIDGKKYHVHRLRTDAEEKGGWTGKSKPLGDVWNDPEEWARWDAHLRANGMRARTPAEMKELFNHAS